MNRELQRILYVEDEPDICRVVKVALEALGGLTVIACASGEEAIAVAPTAAADLFLLDVMMPLLDGPSTLQRLRALPGMANTPAVFMTAKVQPDEIAYFKSIGALDVIAKPFDALTLADSLRAIWRRAAGAMAEQSPLVAVHSDNGGSAGKDGAASSPEATFAARMVPLKARFDSELPGRLQELQQLWVQLQLQWQVERLEVLHTVVHNLAGAGSTFGYDAITVAARALDSRLKVLLAERGVAQGASWHELTALFLALETELRRALALRS